ncbi:DUF551 domain-containing protein [Enterobacter hormaechei]
MSTITKEQAKDLRNAFQCWQQDYDPVEDKEQYDMFGLGMVAMDALLASLEAEAVAYMIGGHYLMHAQDPKVDNYTSAVPLYTAPPAPESVPDVVSWEDVPEEITEDDIALASAWAHGFNQCRAAMLQGAEPVSNRDELPDGWVACSERMPEDEQEVITHNIFGYRHVSFFDEHSGNFFNRLDGSSVDCVEHVLVSHWMPLPAAPQQEVK